MNTLNRITLGAAVATVLIPASPALAATASSGGARPAAQTLQQVQAKVEGALSARQKVLTGLTASVTGNEYLPKSEQQTLESLLSAETQGIDALAAKVPGDTTVAEVRQDSANMVHQFRVYWVMAPQVRLAEGAAAAAAAETKITGLEPRLQTAITRAENRGVDVHAAQAAYNDLVDRVAAATSSTQSADIGVVLQVTPSGYPGDGAPLTTARDALRAARTDLKAARADLKTIRSTLRSGRSGRTSTTA